MRNVGSTHHLMIPSATYLQYVAQELLFPRGLLVMDLPGFTLLLDNGAHHNCLDLNNILKHVDLMEVL